MSTYYSYAMLKKEKDDAYKVVGEVDNLPGGCYFGRIRPILMKNKEGNDVLAFCDGFISNDRKYAYVVYKDFYLKNDELVSSNDEFKMEINNEVREKEKEG